MSHGRLSANSRTLRFHAPLHVANLLFTICLSASALAEAPAAKPQLPVPIQASVSVPPTAFWGNGQRHLSYEIQLTNSSTKVWSIQHLDVRSESGAALLGVEGEELRALLWHPAFKADDKDVALDKLAPGESMVAFMWVDLGKDAQTPRQLRHRFTVTAAGDEQLRELNAPTTMVLNKVPEISAPLRGKDWLAANGPANDSDHRRARIVLDGVAQIGQRYAIDWVQIGANLKSYRGDPKDNHSYLCFGADAVAVADGVVAEFKDGIPENVPNAAPIVPITLETIAGNHINLDLGGGVYALYAHLQPGSLRVKLGDKVKRGQLLGLVGNSGNSSEPHLHFQLMDHNSPLDSEGLPYALPEYAITRRVTGDFEHPRATALPAAELHRSEIPMQMQLVEFK